MAHIETIEALTAFRGVEKSININVMAGLAPAMTTDIAGRATIDWLSQSKPLGTFFSNEQDTIRFKLLF